MKMNVKNEYWYSNQDESVHQISKYEPKNIKYHSKQKKHKKYDKGEIRHILRESLNYFPLLLKISQNLIILTRPTLIRKFLKST